MKKIHISITELDKERLVAAAKQKRTSVSSIVRLAVIEFIDKK